MSHFVFVKKKLKKIKNKKESVGFYKSDDNHFLFMQFFFLQKVLI